MTRINAIKGYIAENQEDEFMKEKPQNLMDAFEEFEEIHEKLCGFIEQEKNWKNMIHTTTGFKVRM